MADMIDVQPSFKAEVLESYELLSVVFINFDPEEPGERRSLLSSARVCRAFKRPALDLLWSKLPSFIPILKLLPQLGNCDGQEVSHLL